MHFLQKLKPNETKLMGNVKYSWYGLRKWRKEKCFGMNIEIGVDVTQ